MFRLIGNNIRSECESSFVAVYADSIKIEEGKTFILKKNEKGNFRGEYKAPGRCLSSSPPFETTDETTGEIYFSKFDLITKIASGTFGFDVVDEEGKTIKIRDGRFDMPFLR